MSLPKIDKNVSADKLNEIALNLRQLELVLGYLGDAKDRGERYYDLALAQTKKLPEWALKWVMEAFPEKYQSGHVYAGNAIQKTAKCEPRLSPPYGATCCNCANRPSGGNCLDKGCNSSTLRKWTPIETVKKDVVSD